MSEGSVFINMGEILSSFQDDGSLSCLKEKMNRSLRVFDKGFESCFRSLVFITSGPAAFPTESEFTDITLHTLMKCHRILQVTQIIYLLRTMVLYDYIYLALIHKPYILVQTLNANFPNNRKSFSFKRIHFLFHSPSLSQLALWTEPMTVKFKMVGSSLTKCRYMFCFIVKSYL